MSRTRSSDGRSPRRSDATEPAGASSPDDAGRSGSFDPEDAEEEGLDLSDLERFDAAPPDFDHDEEFVFDKPSRGPRSPVLSLIVLAIASYLLATMWSDFRYWLQSSEPVDLGYAADFVQDGRVPAGWHDTYVVLEGTPDVQHAARLTTNEGYVGYLRITEGDGQLFAAVPRGPDDEVTNNFEGRFVGRMRKLGSDRAFPWLEQFFAAERVTRSIDTSAAQLIEALQSADAAFVVESGEGRVHLEPDDRVRLVVARPEARVQLGVSTFPDAAEAENRVASLGYPYAKVGQTPTFHSFVVRIPTDERDSAHTRLVEGLDLPEASPDPKVGVAVLPMTATFTMPVSALQLEGPTLVFPYGDNTTVPGYEVSGTRLLAPPHDGSTLVRIAGDELSAVRLEKPIQLDPRGYLIVVGADPSSARMLGILWLVTLGLGLVNLASLLLWWRRRA